MKKANIELNSCEKSVLRFLDNKKYDFEKESSRPLPVGVCFNVGNKKKFSHSCNLTCDELNIALNLLQSKELLKVDKSSNPYSYGLTESGYKISQYC